jgi:hypothetical protein
MTRIREDEPPNVGVRSLSSMYSITFQLLHLSDHPCTACFNQVQGDKGESPSICQRSARNNRIHCIKMVSISRV